MAQAAGDQKDKALWLTLGQSWVRLAEQWLAPGDRSLTLPTAMMFLPSTLPIETGCRGRARVEP